MYEGREEGHEMCEECVSISGTIQMEGEGKRWEGSWAREVEAKHGLTREIYRLEDINRTCLDQFRSHWQCLENNNQQLWQCRGEEWKLSACVFDKLVSSPPPFETSGPFPRS